MVREDSLTHRIYGEVANNFSGSELLLYDYSLGVNDTVTVYSLSFWLWMCYPVAETLKVIQVDSIYLAGQYRKRLQVDGLWMSSFIPEYWIEGIGSTFGLMWPGLSAYIAWDIPYPRLICFEQDGNLIYHDPDFIQCWAPSGVSIPENQDDDMIMIYPNPAAEKVKIISPEIIKSYTLYSVSGTLLQEGNPCTTAFSIDLSSYTQGIYLLSIVTNQGKIVRKIGKNR